MNSLSLSIMVWVLLIGILPQAIGRVKLHLHALHAMDESAAQQLGLLRLDVGHHAQQLAEDRAQLGARQRGAQAEMGPAAAEPEVAVGVARQVEAPRVRRTPARRGCPSGRRAPPSPPPPAAGRGSRPRGWWCGGRSAPARPSARTPRPPRGSLPSRSSISSARWSGLTVSARIAWEVVWRVVSLPATDSSTKNAADLGVGEPLAVDLGLHEGRHQVVAGVLFAVRRELGRELGQRPQRLAEHLDRRGGRRRTRGPATDTSTSAAETTRSRSASRHADHVRDRHQRQPLGDQLDEVAAAGRRGLLDDLLARSRGCPPRSAPPGAA